MEKLTDEQKLFLEAEGRVIVKACPGSGKTYAVANKLLSYINNWSKYHQGIAALSFTNVASNEIYEKANSIHNGLGKLGYPHFIGTVDSFINEFIVLRYGHLYTFDRVRPQIALTDNWKIPYRFWRTECHRNGCVENIEKFHYGIDGYFYKGKNAVSCELRKAKMLPCQQYKKMLADKNIVFQNETALVAYRLLKKYPIIANAVSERFPIIIIDEAQDTSIDQMAVFDLLSEAGINSIFLVGDPDQAIYEWRDENPECFLEKMNNHMWQNIELTGNFRSSQNICNVTSFFSASLQGNNFNIAVGKWKDEKTKPILLLMNNNTEEEVISYFLEKCKNMEIDGLPENIAVLTRGRIYSDTDIGGLWKSKEIETFAKSAYEWNEGSRKKAYKGVSKASYEMIFGEDIEDYLMIQKIQDYTDEEKWKNFVVEVLSNMPGIDLGIGEWVKSFSIYYCEIVKKYGFELSTQKSVKDYFKIKARDKSVPHFKEIPLKNYLEKKKTGKYTRSSIHGVKGESYDAVLIYIKSCTGKTITPKFLMEGNLEDELMRIAYVAMTRPRRLLMIAMPETKKIKEYKRFPADKWDYERIIKKVQDAK